MFPALIFTDLQYATERLGSEVRQPTNQSLSLPYLVQGNLGPSLWHNQSRPSA